MKDILTFIGEHYWITFFLALIAGSTIVGVFEAIVKIFKR